MFFHYSVMISVEKSCMSKKCINSTVDNLTRDSSLKLDVHQVCVHFLSASYYFVYFSGETYHICVSIQVLFSFVALFVVACIILLHWSSSFLLVKLFIPLRNNRKEREPKKL